MNDTQPYFGLLRLGREGSPLSDKQLRDLLRDVNFAIRFLVRIGAYRTEINFLFQHAWRIALILTARELGLEPELENDR